MRTRTPSILLFLCANACSYAQLSISWWTIDGGGGTSFAGTLSIHGSIAQHDAGPVMRGGSLSIAGGFWATAVNNACPADLDDGTFTGTPDGGVTIDDLLYFLDQYAQGNTRADLDDGSGTGTPDGGVTIDDLLYFLDRYEAGC